MKQVNKQMDGIMMICMKHIATSRFENNMQQKLNFAPNT